MAARNGLVLAGNNEDFIDPNTSVWFLPPEPGKHGRVYFGFGVGLPQGGMNDQGLCMDGNGLPMISMNAYPSRERVYYEALLELLLECQNVSDVIDWFNSHYLGSTWSCQLHFADANGDAIVVSVADREFTFTNKSYSHYLVSTNFNLANYNNGWWPCGRYNTATQMLAQITSEEDLTVDACRDVLDAVHQDGTYATKYSNIFDPINLKIHLYYDRNFNERVSLNLDSELATVQPGGTGVLEENQLYFKEINLAFLFVEDPIITGYPIYILIFFIAVLSLGVLLSKLKKNA